MLVEMDDGRVEVLGQDRCEAARTELQALKVTLDARFKKLDKVLPDLKSQDIQGSLNHARYHATPTDRATAARLGWTVDDYMESKEAGELPELPELPPEPERVKGKPH